MGVSKNWGTPKSSILIEFSLINHPFWGTPIFGNTHIYIYTYITFIYLFILFTYIFLSFPPHINQHYFLVFSADLFFRSIFQGLQGLPKVTSQHAEKKSTSRNDRMAMTWDLSTLFLTWSHLKWSGFVVAMKMYQLTKVGQPPRSIGYKNAVTS